MPRYRSKPREIEAERFVGSLDPRTGHLVDVPQELRHPKAFRWHLGRFEVWNGLHEQWMHVRPGDWLRMDNPDDIYPIDQQTFERTYEPVEEVVPVEDA